MRLPRAAACGLASLALAVARASAVVELRDAAAGPERMVPYAAQGLALPPSALPLGDVRGSLGSLAVPAATLALDARLPRARTEALWRRASGVFDNRRAVKGIAAAAAVVAAAAWDAHHGGALAAQALALHHAAVFWPFGSSSRGRSAPEKETRRQGPPRLEEYQHIRLRPAEPLSSELSEPGRVDFFVLENVVVNGVTVVQEGTRVPGRLYKVKRRGHSGVPGHLEIELSYITTVDNQRIALANVPVQGADRQALARRLAPWTLGLSAWIPGGAAVVDERHPLTTINKQASRPIRWSR